MFYLPDTSSKLQLQGISKCSNANGTSAATRLSTQTSGDGHGGFTWHRVKKEKNGGYFTVVTERGSRLCWRQNAFKRTEGSRAKLKGGGRERSLVL